MNQICILRLSALGDCCHALSVAQHLRDAFPNSKVVWIIGKTEHQLFKEINGVEFVVIDKSKLLRSLWNCFVELRKLRFDVLLNLHASATANLISLCVRAKRKIGFDRERARDGQEWFCSESIEAIPNQHVAEGMMGFIAQLNIQATSPKWRPLVLEPEEEQVREHIDPERLTCLISPCSSQRYGDKYNRSWSSANFIEIMRYLSEERGIQTIITGGTSAIEKQYLDHFKSQNFEKNVVNLMGKTTIRQMASLIKMSDFVISPDSGPAHIATIMNKPVIGLYAMSNPDRTGPYKSKELLVNRYPEALSKFLGKSVVDVKWGQKVKTPEAMGLIRPADVIKKIEKLLVMLAR
jgi:heptosyltransferase I